MRTIEIPYHKGKIPIHVDEANLAGVLEPKESADESAVTGPELVRAALASPIGSKSLHELSEGKKKVVIVTSDHTRSVPSSITLPILLEEIRRGNPDAEITILIATGLHRPTTEEEQRSMFGDVIVDNERIVVSNAFCDEDFGFVDVLPSGAELHVHKEALSADLLVTEGFIEPHFFAGFSGGRKSILPGICNAVTVNENHSYRQIASPFSTAGELARNPIHRDMVYAARAVNVQFILNVALNDQKEIIGAFAGDLEKAHDVGVAFVKERAFCKNVMGDIVVTSNGGYPLDQNLYQSPKAVRTAENCCRENGVIIMCCACSDGMGGDHFAKIIVSGTPEEIDARLSAIPSKETIPEMWCAQIYADILKKRRIILVADYLDDETIRKANMIPAATPDEALEKAYSLLGRDAKVVVIPDGVAVLTMKEGGE